MIEIELTIEERYRLLRIARDAICASVLEQSLSDLGEDTYEGSLAMCCGAFVTLYKKKDLRGCIGTFDSTRPLADVVRSMATAAVTRDHRFERFTARDLEHLRVSISVLTPLRILRDLNAIEIGRHGLSVTRGRHRGVLLPKVAVERGWDRDEFLDSTCVKAGLPPHAWRSFGRDPEFRIETFESLDFSDDEMVLH